MFHETDSRRESGTMFVYDLDEFESSRNGDEQLPESMVGFMPSLPGSMAQGEQVIEAPIEASNNVARTNPPAPGAEADDRTSAGPENGSERDKAERGPAQPPGSKSSASGGGRVQVGGGEGAAPLPSVQPVDPAAPRPAPPIITLPESEMQYRELVVDRNGAARHAGSDVQEGTFVDRYRRSAEQNLYLFAKGILNRHFLTPHFHKQVCEFVQQRPPFRKLILMPREHAKTAICSGSLPAHVLIQPAEGNIYFPGMSGRECRILLAGETETMAKKNLRVIKDGIFSSNQLFKALWPECVWERPKAQSSEWSANAIIIPRDNEWPDPSIRAVGVGGAITGARPNFMIKDDLVSFAAANSEIVMQEAIDWHVASRALLETYETETGNQSWEVTIGTRWAVFDLYSYMIDNDPSVEVIDERFHKILNDGRILWPEKYTLDDIEQLRREYGSMFYLLFMNTAADPSLTDFDLEQIRYFDLRDGKLIFNHDTRDFFMEEARKRRGEAKAAELEESNAAITAQLDSLRGRRLRDAFDLMRGREEFLKSSGVRFRTR